MKLDESTQHNELNLIIQSYHREEHIDELKDRISAILAKDNADMKMKAVLKFITSITLSDFDINYNRIDFIKLNENFYQKVNKLRELLSRNQSENFRSEFLDDKNIIAQDFVFYVQSILKIQMILNLIEVAKSEQHKNLLFYALARIDTALSELDNFNAGSKYKSITGTKKAQTKRQQFENFIIGFLKEHKIPFYLKSKISGKEQKNYRGIFIFLKKHTSELENFSGQKLKVSITKDKEVNIELIKTNIKRIIQPNGPKLNQKLEFIFRSPR